MIVKNEESTLYDCLYSVKDVIDQLVIIDTGSTDKTLEIAEKFGAEIYHYKWIQDFSAARNESIKYATMDWIFWIDADERLLPESKEKLINSISKTTKPTIIKVHIKNIKPDGANFSISDAHRLFTNHKGIYFTGAIHEQISPSAGKIGGVEKDSEIMLYHLGYGYSGDKAKEKHERNIKLLLQQLENDKGNAYTHMTLGHQYGRNKEYGKSLEHYHFAYKNNRFDKAMKASLLNVMSESYFYQKQYGKAREFSQKSIQLVSSQAAGYFMLFRVADASKNHKEGAKQLSKLLVQTRELRRSPKRLSSDILIEEDRILNNLAQQQQLAGQLEEAWKNYHQVLKSKPGNTIVLEKLTDIALQTGRISKGRFFVDQLLEKSPNHKGYLLIKGNILIKEQNFTEAADIYEILLANDSENIQIKNRLAGLYAKLGQMEKVQTLLKTN